MDCLRSLQADDLPHRMWNPTATCVFKTLTGQFTVLQFCGTLSYLRYLRYLLLIAMDLIYSSRYLLLAIRRTTMQQCLKTLSRPIGNKTFFVYRWFSANAHTWKKIDVRRYSDRHRLYFTSDWDEIGFEIFTFINLSPDLSPLSLSSSMSPEAEKNWAKEQKPRKTRQKINPSSTSGAKTAKSPGGGKEDRPRHLQNTALGDNLSFFHISHNSTWRFPAKIRSNSNVFGGKNEKPDFKRR